MKPDEKSKTLVQCDFDGTITEEDVSFAILDNFAGKDWRRMFEDYREGKISVAEFNTMAFAMVKEEEETLSRFVLENAKMRKGFLELLSCCQGKGLRFVIVSNGLDFYIRTILKSMGLNNLEAFAARSVFSPDGIKTRYIGPEGDDLQDGFKEAYTRHFIKDGYRIIYMGNGISDAPPARLADSVFATGPLLSHCKELNLNCTPFNDLIDVVRGLELLTWPDTKNPAADSDDVGTLFQGDPV